MYICCDGSKKKTSVGWPPEVEVFTEREPDITITAAGRLAKQVADTGDAQMNAECEESVGEVSRTAGTEMPRGTRSWSARLLTLLILWVVFSVASSVIGPPDMISGISLMVEMFIVYGGVIFAVSRFRSFKQTPESMRRVIVGLVCLLSIATVSSSMLYMHCRHLSTRLYEQTMPPAHPE